MAEFYSWSRWLIIKVPIYGQLINSDRKSMRAAFYELGVATIFSLFPIWFYPIVMKVSFQHSFWSSADAFIRNGELFLFSSALVGPLIYSITKKYGVDESDEADSDGNSEVSNYRIPRIKSIQFPYGFWFVFFSIIICIFASIFFGFMRVSPTGFPSMNLDRNTLFNVSILMYLFTLSCYFCVSVYRLNLETTTEVFGEDTRELIDRWGQEND